MTPPRIDQRRGGALAVPLRVPRPRSAPARVDRRRGGALLAVLWLTMALSAIVFALAWSARSELERAGANLDGARAQFLAQGAIERFLLHLAWGRGVGPAGDPRIAFRPGQRRLTWNFPAGVVDLEITGENGKLDLYNTPPLILYRLFVGLGVDDGRASQLAASIAGMRQAAAANFSAGPSFSSVWPSFLQVEDLLKVPGMTPDIFYGWWERDPDGRLVERGGAGRHLTLLGEYGVNVNYASPAVLRALGLPEDRIAEILQLRETRVIEDVSPFGWEAAGPAAVRLAAGGASAYTVRATARLNGRPLRRTVSALVRFGRNRMEPPLEVVRWYPNAN